MQLLVHGAGQRQVGRGGGELTDLRELATGRLRVGAFATADASLVPKAITAFRAAYPAVRVTLTEDYTPGLAEQLRAAELDVAILSGDGPFEGLDLRKLRDDTMLVALPAGHRLARRRRVRLVDLAGEDWIAGRDRPEDTLISSCLAHGFRPRIGFVAGTGWPSRASSRPGWASR